MKINWNYILIAALALFVLLLLWDAKCNRGKIFSGKQSHGDTLRIKVDSTIYRDTGSITIIPTLVKETIWKHDTLRMQDETAAGFVPPPPAIDSALLKDYLTTREYNDTTRFDSNFIAVNSIVFGNKLVRSKVSHSIKTTSTSTTITVKPPAKNTLYLSGNVTGLDFWSAGIGLGLKNKKDRFYEATINSNIAGQKFITVSYKIPIRLSKQ